MSKNSISIRIQPQGGRALAGQNKHDLRDPKHTPEYVDSGKSDLNSVILAPPSPENLRKEIAANREKAGQQALRADSRTSIAGIITFGVDAQPLIAAMTRGDQDALFLKVAERLAKETARPLLGLVVHRDESAPHAHFVLRGYELRDGKEYAPRFDRRDLARLQDIAAEEVANLGIERGTPKAEREARGESKASTVHRSVAQLHADLPAELEAARATVAAATEKRDEYQRLADKARKKATEAGADVEKLEKRAATYEKRIADQQAEILLKRREIENMEAMTPNQERRAVDFRKSLKVPIAPKYEEIEAVTGSIMGFKQSEKMRIISPDSINKFISEINQREEKIIVELVRIMDAGTKELADLKRDPVISARLQVLDNEKSRRDDERMKEREAIRREARELGESSRKARDDWGLGD